MSAGHQCNGYTSDSGQSSSNPRDRQTAKKIDRLGGKSVLCDTTTHTIVLLRHYPAHLLANSISISGDIFYQRVASP